MRLWEVLAECGLVGYVEASSATRARREAQRSFPEVRHFTLRQVV